MLWIIAYVLSVIFYNSQNQVISDCFGVIINEPVDNDLSFESFVNNKEFANYEKRNFTKWVEESKYLSYLQDEKEMMLSAFNNTPVKHEKCKTTDGWLFVSFFLI